MKSFEEVWHNYEKQLSTFVLSRVYDVEVQKEIMQEVALKIFTSIHQQKKHLRGWIYQITKNVIIDYYRKENKPLPEFQEIEASDGHIMQECLTPMLSKLSKVEQEILKLHYFQEYSLSEIAQMKQMPLNTVKSKLHRAKKSLGRAFFSCCDYEKNARGDTVNFTLRSPLGCNC